MHQATQKEQPWQQIISSPMRRCLAFAQHLQQTYTIALEQNDGLRELSFGDWDGQPISTIHQQTPEQLKQFWHDPFSFTPPNGEPMQHFCQRIEQAFEQIIKAHQGQHVLLITHGGVIRILLSQLLQTQQLSLFRFDVPYASLSRIHIYHDEQGNWPQLVFFNR